MSKPSAPLAVITGTSSGIGAAIARRLLRDGWRVCGLDRAPASIVDPAFQAVSADLSDGAATDAVAQQILAVEAPFAFVHAAGLMHTGALGALDAAAGEHMWRVHVDAATRLANALLPAMQAAGRGRVILLSSRVARGLAGRSQYTATKAALGALARSWAAEVIAAGITVNLIAPAATDTPMLHAGERASSAPMLPPLGRLIQPDEIAALAAFLLSPDAAAITGQEIAVCGGSSLPR